MIEMGERISRDLQLWITVMTIVIMVGGLVPKPWKKRRAPLGVRR
jgi:hypothetical protein